MATRSRHWASLLAIGFLAAVFVPFLSADWLQCIRYNLALREPIAANDRFNRFFGYRRELNHAYLFVNFKVLAVTQQRNVIHGRSGWLFYGDPASCRPDGRIEPLSMAELQQIVDELEKRRKWLASRNIRYLVVLAPEKQTVYPEYLPQSLPGPQAPSRLDQIVDYAKRHSQLDIIDPRQALEKAKARHDVYYKTDSHWTSAGAYCAYAEIMERIHAYDSAASAIPWAQIKLSPGKHQGDLAKLLLGPDAAPEETTIGAPEVGWGWKPSLFEKVVSPVADKIRRPDPVPPTINDGAELGTLVVFHDSFYYSGAYEYVCRHFKRTVSVWTHDFDYDLVTREHPDFVIQESAERLLTQWRPRNFHAD